MEAAVAFERLRERLERLMAELTPQSEPGERAALLKEAAVELKLGIEQLRRGLPAIEEELAVERKELEQAERRGRMAAAIEDTETVKVAEEFATRQRERIALLERKLALQRDELAVALRELDEIKSRLKNAKLGLDDDGNLSSVNAAWRELEAAGGVNPDTDVAGELDQARYDRKAKEAAVEAQLEYLKKKLGRDE